MAIAILSDIDSNIDALRAVVEDVAQSGTPITLWLVVGNVLGYGADPVGCVRLLDHLGAVVLRGRLETAIADETGWNEFGKSAAAMLSFQREQLRNNKLESWLRALPLTWSESGLCASHDLVSAQLKHPVTVQSIASAKESGHSIEFPETSKAAVIGGGNIPWVAARSGLLADAKSVGWKAAMEINDSYIVGSGSVGRPHDKDKRACYLLVDGGILTWRRVDYDVSLAVSRMRELPYFSPALGERMEMGV